MRKKQTPEERRLSRIATQKRYRRKHAKELKEYRAKYHLAHRDEENLKRKIRRCGLSIEVLNAEASIPS